MAAAMESQLFRTGSLDRPALTIVIPALNEEQAIASIIERCLNARAMIMAKTPVSAVDIVVVSDGSTDRTAEIAASYSEIHLIEFPRNQGYGAAIQAGWQARPNELLAFLDADGTCDPLYFIPMCNSIFNGDDIAIGSRMGPDSEMPSIRRVGNRIYAFLLRLLSRRQVRDSASGMRVVRRSVLHRLLPLPDGLHFTPAMSARALLDDLAIGEIAMSYRERIGRSKLNVIKDGVRFLQIILATALYVRPSGLILSVCALLIALSVAMITYPTWVYIQHHEVEEWMIYRFLLSGLFVTVSSMLVSATYTIEQLIAVSRADFERRVSERSRWWTRVNERSVGLAILLLALAGLYLAWPAILSYLATRQVTLHWSRVVTAMFCELISMQLGISLGLSWIVRGVVRQQAPWLAVLRNTEARVEQYPQNERLRA